MPNLPHLHRGHPIPHPHPYRDPRPERMLVEAETREEDSAMAHPPHRRLHRHHNRHHHPLHPHLLVGVVDLKQQ